MVAVKCAQILTVKLRRMPVATIETPQNLKLRLYSIVQHILWQSPSTAVTLYIQYYISLNASLTYLVPCILTLIFTPRACARGKVIGLSVCCHRRCRCRISVKPGLWTHGLDSGLDCGLRFGLDFGLIRSSMTTISNTASQ